MEILLSNSNNTCRICSSQQGNLIFIFGEEGKQLNLQVKIRKYLYITVSSDDKFPKMICNSCYKKLDAIHKFASMAVKIQNRFKQLLSDTEGIDNNNGGVIKYGIDVETKGLLHSYLTKGKIETRNTQSENDITEMEVRVDPSLFLQCLVEEDNNSDIDNDESDTDSEINSSSQSMTNEPDKVPLPKMKLTEVTSEHFNSKPLFTNSKMDFQPKIEQKAYNCTICPKGFQSEIALQNHLWNHLSIERRVLTNADNNSLLKRNLTEEVSNNRAVDMSSENLNLFSCPVCGKQISTKGNLKVHLETHRPKGKYGCDICGRIFKTQSNLLRHKEYHEGIQFPCEVCGRVYPTNSTLRAHSITHSDLRPHKCPLCDKTFKRNQDLKFHINQHTGARPYQCLYCPKAFASSGNCFSHRKRMHPQEVERDRERAAEIMR